MLSGTTMSMGASPIEGTQVRVTEIERGTGDRISGSFVLCHEFVCTNPIETNASASEMKYELELLPSVKRVEVSREDMKGANGEYEWYVTFTGSIGDVSEMIWSRDAEFYNVENEPVLNGTNARVLVSEAHRGSYLGGTFDLMYAGHRTRSLRFDASASEFRDVLIEDMPTLQSRDEIVVTRSETREVFGGFTWQITFPSKLGDVETIEVDT